MLLLFFFLSRPWMQSITLQGSGLLLYDAEWPSFLTLKIKVNQHVASSGANICHKQRCLSLAGQCILGSHCIPGAHCRQGSLGLKSRFWFQFLHNWQRIFRLNDCQHLTKTWKRFTPDREQARKVTAWFSLITARPFLQRPFCTHRWRPGDRRPVPSELRLTWESSVEQKHHVLQP